MIIGGLQNNTSSTASFKAVCVKQLKPVLDSSGAVFFNDLTIRLKKPQPFFTGIQKLMNFLINNENKFDKSVFTLSGFAPAMRRMQEIMENFPFYTFRKRKLFSILGSGANKTAFLLDKNETVCACDNMKVFDERKFQEFDLPILSKGLYKQDNRKGWFIRKFGEPVNSKELKQLRTRIEAVSKKQHNDLFIVDWSERQACKINKTPYLLDFECVQSYSDSSRLS